MSDTLSIELTPGYDFQDGEVLTPAKLRAIARPQILLLGTIATETVDDGAITTAKLADGALSADATGRAKMEDGYVTTEKLADGAVTGVKLGAGSVTTAKLADEALSADTTGHGKMADGFLSADAEGRAKMEDGYVTTAKLATDVAQGLPQYAAGVFGAGVYAVTLSPAATAYTAGMLVRFKADSNNTGATNINVNGLGSKDLFRRNDIVGSVSVFSELSAGEIAIGQIVEAVYDGTQFQLLEPRIARYASAATALGTATLIDDAHNLGGRPTRLRAVLVNVTAQFGYVTGDEVDISTTQNNDTSLHYSFGCNATNAWLISRAGGPNLLRKDTGAIGTITPANWTVRLYAEL